MTAKTEVRYCDCCSLPGTEENPVTLHEGTAAYPDTYAHADCDAAKVEWEADYCNKSHDADPMPL